MASLNAIAKENSHILGYWGASIGLAMVIGAIGWSIGANGTAIGALQETDIQLQQENIQQNLDIQRLEIEFGPGIERVLQAIEALE